MLLTHDSVLQNKLQFVMWGRAANISGCVVLRCHSSCDEDTRPYHDQMSDAAPLKLTNSSVNLKSKTFAKSQHSRRLWLDVKSQYQENIRYSSTFCGLAHLRVTDSGGWLAHCSAAHISPIIICWNSTVGGEWWLSIIWIQEKKNVDA